MTRWWIIGILSFYRVRYTYKYMSRSDIFYYVLLGAFCSLVFFSLGADARAAADLFFSPSQIEKSVGTTLTVAAKVDTKGAAINAGEGVISFDTAKLEVL